MQLWFLANEIAIPLHRVVVPKGDLDGLLFNNPVAFHVADVEGGDFRKLGDKFFEGCKVVLQHRRVFDRGDRQETWRAEERGAYRAGDASFGKEVFYNKAAIGPDIVLVKKA